MDIARFAVRRRDVRIGGWRIGRWRVGGGWYTVEPLTVSRFYEFVGIVGSLPGINSDNRNIMAFRAAAPLLVAQPIKPSHLRRMDDMQLVALMAAAAEVQDLEYCMTTLGISGDPPEDTVSIAAVVVDVAERFKLDPYSVLLWPVERFCAVLDAQKELREATERARDKSQAPSGDLAAVLKGIGIGVN